MAMRAWVQKTCKWWRFAGAGGLGAGGHEAIQRRPEHDKICIDLFDF